MKWGRTVAVLMAVTVVAAACGDDSGSSSSSGSAPTGGSKENTGEVNLLSAAEPEEAAAYQKIFDDLINSQVDYNAEVESSADFEEQFQIRAEGGTLDLAAVPQPGAIAGLVDKGSLVALEDLGLQHRRPEQPVRRVVRRARGVQGQALRRPDQHQPQEHGLVPEGCLRCRGLQGARDVGRACSP